MSGPISPKEATDLHESGIPTAVFDVVNKILAEKFSGDGEVYILQDEVVDALVDLGLKKSDLFEKRWLDIEAHYRKAGWKVEYDKPAYCETYKASWTFSRKRKTRS